MYKYFLFYFCGNYSWMSIIDILLYLLEYYGGYPILFYYLPTILLKDGPEKSYLFRT